MSDVGWVVVGVVVLLLVVGAVVALVRGGTFGARWGDSSITARAKNDGPVQESVKAGRDAVADGGSSPVQRGVVAGRDAIARAGEPDPK